jgi:ABC-type cobalamin/Fe3+-siderophores transport system ATPase subunit
MLISNIRSVLEICFKSNETLMIEGPHGIGKSEVVANFATENNMHNETLFLSNQEVGDLIGMPRSIERNGEVIHTWTKPIWLQKMEEAVMPAKFDVDDLEFSDEDFKAFVYSKLKELNEVSKGQI